MLVAHKTTKMANTNATISTMYKTRFVSRLMKLQNKSEILFEFLNQT
jgi:hypothetical protein